MQTNQQRYENTFCKNSNKIFKQFIYVMLAYLIISNVRFLFIEEQNYLFHLLSDLFYSIVALVIWIFEDYFKTDCIHYDAHYFNIDNDQEKNKNVSYRFDEIVKINYMPYVRVLTIKMQKQNTYVDISPYNYNFKEFEAFLEHLESYQPISRGFYIPHDGLESRASKVVAYSVLIIFSSLIILGIISQIFYTN